MKKKLKTLRSSRKPPKRKPKKVRLRNLKVDSKVKNEVERLIKKFKRERKKKLEPYEIIWGYIKMTKHYKLNNELEIILFEEKAKW